MHICNVNLNACSPAFNTLSKIQQQTFKVLQWFEVRIEMECCISLKPNNSCYTIKGEIRLYQWCHFHAQTTSHKTFMKHVWGDQTHSERLPLSPTGNKAEALCLYSDPCPLYMLLHIPAKAIKTWVTACEAFSVSHTLIWVHGCNACILAYQLIKLLFPAEWFPINITVIFFRGGSKLTPTVWAIDMSPTGQGN